MDSGWIKTEGWTQNRERLDSGWIKRERGWTKDRERGWTQAGYPDRERLDQDREKLDSRQRGAGLKTERGWTQDMQITVS